MRKLELDLPLDGTPISRFLFWLTAGLVYLALIAFTIAALADVQLRAFARQPHIVTVALPPNADGAAGRIEVQAILAHVRELPGVAYASLVDEAEIDNLVEPWLSTTSRDEGPAGGIGLPLPRLIDIAYNPGAEVDIGALDAALEAIVEGATVGDAGLLQRSQERLARTFRTAGAAVGLALLALLLVAVGWLTRLGLEQHGETVDLLRQMGARDRYVARQLEHHALIKGLRGALLGFTAAIATTTAVLQLPRLLGQPPLIPGELAPLHWVLLAIVPVATALAIALAARLTAVFGLAMGR
jgi:cell division transport system permease protein